MLSVRYKNSACIIIIMFRYIYIYVFYLFWCLYWVIFLFVLLEIQFNNSYFLLLGLISVSDEKLIESLNFAEAESLVFIIKKQLSSWLIKRTK